MFWLVQHIRDTHEITCQPYPFFPHGLPFCTLDTVVDIGFQKEWFHSGNICGHTHFLLNLIKVVVMKGVLQGFFLLHLFKLIVYRAHSQLLLYESQARA